MIAPGPGDDRFDGVPVVRVNAASSCRATTTCESGCRWLRVGAAAPRASPPTSCTSRHPPCSAPPACGPPRRLGIPSVAVFQTDLAGFARRNGLGRMIGGDLELPALGPRAGRPHARAVDVDRVGTEGTWLPQRRAVGARRRPRTLPPRSPLRRPASLPGSRRRDARRLRRQARTREAGRAVGDRCSSSPACGSSSSATGPNVRRSRRRLPGGPLPRLPEQGDDLSRLHASARRVRAHRDRRDVLPSAPGVDGVGGGVRGAERRRTTRPGAPPSRRVTSGRRRCRRRCRAPVAELVDRSRDVRRRARRRARGATSSSDRGRGSLDELIGALPRRCAVAAADPVTRCGAWRSHEQVSMMHIAAAGQLLRSERSGGLRVGGRPARRAEYVAAGHRCTLIDPRRSTTDVSGESDAW